MLYVVISARNGYQHVTPFYAANSVKAEEKARGLIPAGYSLRYVALVTTN